MMTSTSTTKTATTKPPKIDDLKSKHATLKRRRRHLLEKHSERCSFVTRDERDESCIYCDRPSASYDRAEVVALDDALAAFSYLYRLATGGEIEE